MAIPFNRQQVSRWQKLSEGYSIDYKSQIGKGAFGIVYQGYSKERDCLIAIKVIQDNALSKREIETLVSLSSLSHPNIMGYFGEITVCPNIFLLLEYCNNGTLSEWIQKGIPEAKVLKLFRETIEGMCYMNAKQKMHRDFKPENILIGPEEDIKVSDFGLAQTTNSIFMTGRRGTPLYAAPEVFLLQNQEIGYSFNCDVWSAGLILYEMLMGEKLFKDVKDYNELKEEWLLYERGLKQAKLTEKHHPLWEYFVNYMIQFDPLKRPTFHQVLENLKKVYERMKKSIQNKTNMISDLKMQQVNLYINYHISKYQILLDVCEKFTRQDIRINKEFLYSCMFMCLLRYTLFAKEFIRNLRYKRLKFEERDLLNNSEQPEVEMLCDKNRFNLEHRLAFYSKQLKANIADKILNTYCKRTQSESIMQSLEEVVLLVTKYWRGEAIENNQQLCQLFQNIFKAIQKKHKDYRKKFNLDEMRLFALLMVSMLLQQKFPESEFSRLNIEHYILKISSRSKEELQTFVEQMHDELCN